MEEINGTCSNTNKQQRLLANTAPRLVPLHDQGSLAIVTMDQYQSMQHTSDAALHSIPTKEDDVPYFLECEKILMRIWTHSKSCVHRFL